MYESIIESIKQSIYQLAGQEFHINSKSEFMMIEERMKVPADFVSLKQAYMFMNQAEKLHRCKERKKK